MIKIARTLLIIGTVTSLTFLSGCGANNATKAGAIGALAGGALGAALGDKPGREKQGAIIGTVVGGGLGAFIGSRMDNQAAALEQVPGMNKVTVHKKEGKQRIESRMQIHFDSDDDQIKYSEMSKLDNLANTLSKYPENIVVIEGHTDSTGEDYDNQDLSERRAQSIQDYLNAKNLKIANLSSKGFGETNPVAANNTPDGRASNRRVEIKITIDQKRAEELYKAQPQQ